MLEGDDDEGIRNARREPQTAWEWEWEWEWGVGSFFGR